MKLKDKHIGVLMGGWGPEREVSLKSGKAVLDSLIKAGYDAVAIEAGDDLVEKLKREKIEVAFVALHGPVGEDGIIQGVLEFLRIPYTGSGVVASALCMDKRISKRIFEAEGIPTAKWEAIRRGEKPSKINSPMVVKPARQGSSVGVRILREDNPRELDKALKDAFSLDEWVIVEEYVEGKEITVGVLDGEPLGCVEIVPKGGFYDYERKYTPGMTEYIAPAPIADSVAERIRTLAKRAFLALGCRGAARADFRLSLDNEPKILEVNSIPGLTSTSLLPKSAGVVGMDFDTLVQRMLAGASYERP